MYEALHRDIVATKPEKPTSAKIQTKPRGKKAKVETAIGHYLVERHTYYDNLKSRCQNNDAAAARLAKTTFGRNALVKLLKSSGITVSAGTVSTTLAWKAIKSDLFPDSPRDAWSTIRHSGQKRMGIDDGRKGIEIAEESAGQARGNQTVDAVVRNETLGLIRTASMPDEATGQLVNQLQAGDITDDAAREMLEWYRDGESSRLADLKAERRPRRRRKTLDSDR